MQNRLKCKNTSQFLYFIKELLMFNKLQAPSSKTLLFINHKAHNWDPFKILITTCRIISRLLIFALTVLVGVVDESRLRTLSVCNRIRCSAEWMWDSGSSLPPSAQQICKHLLTSGSLMMMMMMLIMMMMQECLLNCSAVT